jgi:hypothetical protein
VAHPSVMSASNNDRAIAFMRSKDTGPADRRVQNARVALRGRGGLPDLPPAIGEIAFPALLAILAEALYWKAASAGIWLTALSLVGILFLASNKMRLRAIELCVALILLYELPSARRVPPV